MLLGGGYPVKCLPIPALPDLFQRTPVVRRQGSFFGCLGGLTWTEAVGEGDWAKKRGGLPVPPI